MANAVVVVSLGSPALTASLAPRLFSELTLVAMAPVVVSPIAAIVVVIGLAGFVFTLGLSVAELVATIVVMVAPATALAMATALARSQLSARLVTLVRVVVALTMPVWVVVMNTTCAIATAVGFVAPTSLIVVLVTAIVQEGALATMSVGFVASM